MIKTSFNHRVQIIARELFAERFLRQPSELTNRVITGRLKPGMVFFRRFYLSKILIVVLVALLLPSPAAFAGKLDDKKKELQNINAQIEATRDKQGAALKRQAQLNLEIQQSTQKMVQIQIKLNKAQGELNAVIAKKQDTEARLNEARLQLEEKQASLAAAQERLAQKREAFNKRLIGSYKNSKQNVLTVLLSSESLSDFFTRIEFLHMIAEHDGRLVRDMKELTVSIQGEIAQVEAVRKILDEQHTQLIAEKARIDAITNSVIAEQKQLDSEMRRQQQLYAQIEQEKEQLARAEGLLKASSEKVSDEISTLESQRAGRSVKLASIPKDLTALASKTASKYGIPTNIFFALIKQESGWNYRAVSRAGAIGLTQVMPFNVLAMGYDLEEFKNSPADQLEAGARYLSQQYKTFDRWDYALAAYNAGPGAVLRYGGVPPYNETQGYVRNILKMAGQ